MIECESTELMIAKMKMSKESEDEDKKSAIKSEIPKDENSQSPKDEDCQSPKDENSQSPKDEDCQSPKDEDCQNPKDEYSQRPKDEDSQRPKDGDSSNFADQKIENHSTLVIKPDNNRAKLKGSSLKSNCDFGCHGQKLTEKDGNYADKEDKLDEMIKIAAMTKCQSCCELLSVNKQDNGVTSMAGKIIFASTPQLKKCFSCSTKGSTFNLTFATTFNNSTMGSVNNKRSINKNSNDLPCSKKRKPNSTPENIDNKSLNNVNVSSTYNKSINNSPTKIININNNLSLNSNIRSTIPLDDGNINTYYSSNDTNNSTNNSTSDAEDSLCCSICFQSFGLGEDQFSTFGILPTCPHTFCFDCISKWVTQLNKCGLQGHCPSCRGPVSSVIASADWLPHGSRRKGVAVAAVWCKSAVSDAARSIRCFLRLAGGVPAPAYTI